MSNLAQLTCPPLAIRCHEVRPGSVDDQVSLRQSELPPVGFICDSQCTMNEMRVVEITSTWIVPLHVNSVLRYTDDTGCGSMRSVRRWTAENTYSLPHMGSLVCWWGATSFWVISEVLSTAYDSVNENAQRQKSTCTNHRRTRAQQWPAGDSNCPSSQNSQAHLF